MKLRKIVKHLDSFARVELLEYTNGQEFSYWKGSMLSLQCAAGPKEEMEQYIKECYKDEDVISIAEVELCQRYLDWHLDTTSEGEAIGISNFTNERGVSIPKLTIYIKQKKII